MFWFKRKHTVQESTTLSLASPIEIVASKEAKSEIVAKAKEANEKLKALLDENHFTIKIYLAAGHDLQTNKRK